MIRKLVFVLFLFFGFSSVIYAQNIPLLTLKKLFLLNDFELKDEDGAISKAPYDLTTLNVIIPLPEEIIAPEPSNKDVVGIFLVDVFNLRTKLAPRYSDITLRSFKLTGGGRYAFADRWSLVTTADLRIGGNLEKINRPEVFQLGLSSFVSRTFQNEFKLYLGATFHTEVKGIFLAPLFGFAYTGPEERLNAQVLLPASLDISYDLLKEKFRLGVVGKMLLETFKLTGQDERTGEDLSDLYVQHRNIQVGGYGEISFMRDWIRLRLEYVRQSVDLSLYNVAEPSKFIGLNTPTRTQLNPNSAGDNWGVNLGFIINLDASKLDR